MVNPLPDLRPGDFDGGSIFHQVVDGNAASTAQPRFQVLQTDADIVAQACLGNLSPRDGQEVAGCHMYIFALPIYLVGSLHDLVKFLHSNLYQAWMGHPGAIMASGGLAPLIGAHTLQGLLVGLRIVLDGDLGSHAANGVDVTAMAGLDGEQGVGTQEVRGHGHLSAVGIDEVGYLADLFDSAEDVVPAPAVQARRVLTQFVEYLIHFKGCQDGFDEHGGADGAPGDAQFLLGKHKYVIPEAGFQVVLQLGQVEIGSGAFREQRSHIVEEVKGEVEDAARNRLAIDEHMLFRQVPSTRAHQEGRGFFL